MAKRIFVAGCIALVGASGDDTPSSLVLLQTSAKATTVATDSQLPGFVQAQNVADVFQAAAANGFHPQPAQSVEMAVAGQMNQQLSSSLQASYAMRAAAQAAVDVAAQAAISQQHASERSTTLGALKEKALAEARAAQEELVEAVKAEQMTAQNLNALEVAVKEMDVTAASTRAAAVEALKLKEKATKNATVKRASFVQAEAAADEAEAVASNSASFASATAEKAAAQVAAAKLAKSAVGASMGGDDAAQEVQAPDAAVQAQQQAQLAPPSADAPAEDQDSLMKRAREVMVRADAFNR